MKLLFIHHGSRVRISKDGNYYIDTSFNNNIWKRYKFYCDELYAIIRKVPEKFNDSELSKKYNRIDTNLVNLILVDDVYKPKKNFFDIRKRHNIKNTIKNAVKSSDKVIIISAGDYYTNLALKFCKKYKKQYLIEVVAMQFESFWYHGLTGKILAFPIELKFRRAVKKAPYVLYVTDEALQKRYPNSNEKIACSDVEIIHNEHINDIIKYRKDKLKKQNGEIIIGTAATLNVYWKGQQDVIKTLYYLKKKGINKFKYFLVGSGDSSKLNEMIKKYQLDDIVKILGPLPHEKIYEWLKNIDVYIQPSYQEGLSRSILEAMSEGCCVICTDVGGNFELIDNKYLFKKKDIHQLSEKLSNLSNEDILEQSAINYIKTLKYDQKLLDEKRKKFYNSFIMKD